MADRTDGYTARDVLPILTVALAEEADEHYRIGIVRKEGQVVTGGHSLTPVGHYRDETTAGVYGLCVQTACEDGALSGDESDVDCGGAECAPCAIGATCQEDGDCEGSAACGGTTCVRTFAVGVSVSGLALLHSMVLQGAQTVREVEMAAQAVGNTGDVTFLPALQTWTEHDDPDMRERVAIGMRRMPVEATRDFVLGWLSRERSFRVKREIFEVMHLQYRDQGAKLDDALIEQTIAHLDERPRVLTRQSIYRLLTPFAKTRPDVRRALRDALVLELELEKETGQAHFVMGILPQRDVDAALASIESLADRVVANPVPAPAPTGDDDTEDSSPPDDMVGEIGNLGLPDEPPAAGVGAE